MNDPLETALATALARSRLPSPDRRRTIREEVGLTQADLAAAVGVSKASISRWEAGRRLPRRQTLLRYLGALDRMLAAKVDR